jgi:tetratricopeptide (TPR) repeat protein
MKRKTHLLIGFLVPLLLLAALFGIIRPYGNVAPKHAGRRDANPLKLPRLLLNQREAADQVFASGKPKEAIKAYADLVASHADSKDPNVQDQVARARMRIGYSHAKLKDFGAARKVFVETVAQYAGTDAIDPEFGSLPDQAAYQAAVCLAAQGKNKEARREFSKIVAERTKSPVIYQAFRRMQRLGDPNKEEEALLQASIAKQEAWMRFEASVCGPKTIAYLLPHLDLPQKDYKEIAKLCGTTETGTSMVGIRKGLKDLGVETDGLMLNRKDFAKLALPAIWLQDDHYTALLKIEGNTATVYDTRYASKRTVKLPPLDDPGFTATVLVIRDRPIATVSEGSPRR